MRPMLKERAFKQCTYSNLGLSFHETLPLKRNLNLEPSQCTSVLATGNFYSISILSCICFAQQSLAKIFMVKESLDQSRRDPEKTHRIGSKLSRVRGRDFKWDLYWGNCQRFPKLVKLSFRILLFCKYQ